MGEVFDFSSFARKKAGEREKNPGELIDLPAQGSNTEELVDEGLVERTEKLLEQEEQVIKILERWQEEIDDLAAKYEDEMKKEFTFPPYGGNTFPIIKKLVKSCLDKRETVRKIFYDQIQRSKGEEILDENEDVAEINRQRDCPDSKRENKISNILTPEVIEKKIFLLKN
ncbi:MAG: hypothetical protein V1860_02105 [bacterium]